MEYKVCSVCKEEKETIFFGILKSSKNGFRSDCKECRNKKLRRSFIPAKLNNQSLKNEIWKDVIGWEGLYQVSSLGRYKSLDKTVNNPRWNKEDRRIQRGRILIPEEDNFRGKNKGYLIATLTLKRKRTRKNLHRLVALAFIPNPLNLRDVNHKNGIKTDNKVENLEWLSHSDNMKHSIHVLGAKRISGKEHYTYKRKQERLK